MAAATAQAWAGTHAGAAQRGGVRPRCPAGCAPAAAPVRRAAAPSAAATHQFGSSSSAPRHAACRPRRAALAEAPTATVAPPQAKAPLPPLPPLDASYEAACSFADFGNWLIPGRLMLGRYPFVEPSKCRSRDLGEDQLRQLVATGITAFVCLQAEIPPQGEMRLGGVDGFIPYRASATLLATAMSPPPSIEEVAALRTPELDRYLPPRRHPAAWTQRQRIELDFGHCPIVDLGLPEPAQLRALLGDLTARLEAGQNLYVHCWGGRGRAGTVGACLLAHLYGVSAEEALERVQRAFDTRKDGGRRSPETDEQHAFVKEFIAQHY